MDSPAIEHDFLAAERAAIAFKERYEGRIADMPGAELAEAMAEYQRIEEIQGRLVSFASLMFSGDGTDPKLGQFYQSVTERVTAISSHLIFFTLELNRVDEAALEDKLRDPALARWAPWLRDLRVFRPHQLSDEVEKLLHEKAVTGRSAWSRLFDETVAGMRVKIRDEDLTVSAALNKMSDRDRSVREDAAKAIGAAFSDNIRLFSLITNTLAKDKEITDGWRHYARPASYRNRSNMVEDEVVDALSTAVTENYARLSHRYYLLKAKWLGLEKLQHWDRNAPLPGDVDRAISWTEARDQVLSAYGSFSPELAKVGQSFFDNAWIDAKLRPGKSGGAFAHPTVPSVHPYLLVNFHGKTRDVMTLAHELGHGVHQIMAGQQGYLQSGTPLTLAETASVFGEMMTFRALLDAETDPAKRRLMLAAKVEDMLNTVVRQIAFYQFETRLHTERRSGEILPERIGEIWMQVQTESLGPAFEFTPDYSVYWSYIPHFVHSPFYVYAYAFGDCLVNALYHVFQDGHPGVRAQVSRDAARRRHQAAQGIAGAVRARRVGPAILETGPRRGLRLYRRIGACLMADRPMDGGGSSLFGELKRYARTSGAVGGIAARVAGAKVFGIKTDKAAHAEDLKSILGGLKGPLMKVAQILSTIPDALPEEYSQELAQLQANAPPMGWSFVRRRMAGELGSGLASQVQDVRPGRRRRRQPRPGASRHLARWPGGRLQAAISRHGEHGRRRPQAAQAGDERVQADRQGDRGRRHLRRDRRPPARGTRLRARGVAASALHDHAARPAGGQRPGPGAVDDDQAAADHELARWHPDPAMDRQRAAAGGAQRARQVPVHRLVCAVLPLRGHPRRSRTSATTRCAATTS